MTLHALTPMPRPSAIHIPASARTTPATGQHGIVNVHHYSGMWVGVLVARYSAEQLREAAHTLTQLAEYLEADEREAA